MKNNITTIKETNMVTKAEQLLQDYASYSFMEGKIDENTMNHLIEDTQNYVAKMNELKLLSLHNVVGQSEQLLAVAEYIYNHFDDSSSKTAKDYLQDFLSQ